MLKISNSSRLDGYLDRFRRVLKIGKGEGKERTPKRAVLGDEVDEL